MKLLNVVSVVIIVLTAMNLNMNDGRLYIVRTTVRTSATIVFVSFA